MNHSGKVSSLENGLNLCRAHRLTLEVAVSLSDWPPVNCINTRITYVVESKPFKDEQTFSDTASCEGSALSLVCVIVQFASFYLQVSYTMGPN